MAVINDGKWNYSVFTWYDYNLQISLFSKILDDKTIENKGATEDSFFENELYIENTEENKTKYDKDEYTMGYLLLSGKKYYGYIKKSMLTLIGGNNPQQPTSTTIKEQTEKTEQLKTSLDNKVIAIAEEIKKQDNIDITRLSEVPDAIAKLKNSRKRWASGTSLPLLQYEPRGDIYWEFKNLDFKPSIAMVNFSIYNEDSVGSSAHVTENLASFFIKIDSDFDIKFTSAYDREWSLGHGYLKINNMASSASSATPSHKDNSITIVYKDYNVRPKLEYVTIKKWIAFE